MLRAVVLAAVRGEGRTLHLMPPFTDPVDRAVAEFVAARDFLAVALPAEDYRTLTAADTVDEKVGSALEAIPYPPGTKDRAAFAARYLSDRTSGPNGPAR